MAPEDEARAAIYGLIARLFYAPPDQDVLAQVLHSSTFEGSQAPVAVAWRELVDACRNAFPVVLENEHTALFVGTGKAEVTPYLTHYTIKYATDNPLVDLRQQLNRWGMRRKENAHEPEDHIAGICEAMRFAIAVQQRAIEEQKMFFDRHIYRGGDRVLQCGNCLRQSRFLPAGGAVRACILRTRATRPSTCPE